MIQDVLADQILDYLNGRITLPALVHWAEDAILTFTESDQRPANADAIWDMLLYLGAGDTPDFPLTWDIIKEFLERLGHPVQQVVA